MSERSVWQYDKQCLVDALRATEHHIRQLQAEQNEIVAAIAARGTQSEYGYPSVETLLVDVLNVSRREARRRADRAEHLHERCGIGGAPVAALAPKTAAALAAGSISVEHVDEITATLAHLPAATPAETMADLEATLVELAQQVQPLRVREAGKHAIAVLDPDGPEPDVDDELAHPKRELYLQQRRDGYYGLTGILDPESGHLLTTLLSPLAKPRPAEDGTRDRRLAPQRMGDALADLLELTQQAVERPTEGGERATVVVTMTLDQICGPQAGTRIVNGRPVLADGTPISIGQARRLACDAKMIPAVLGGESEILDQGRAERTATPAQRRALRLRDRGCVKCGRPDRWCQAHHITEWEHGGETDLDNMCLLCSECHRLVHHAGWRIHMTRGKPTCIPPDWLTHTTHTTTTTADAASPAMATAAATAAA